MPLAGPPAANDARPNRLGKSGERATSVTNDCTEHFSTARGIVDCINI
jgi:hypothetical protein